jgi:ABC-type nickel/cobalt efflux system permease component RcnA
MLKERKVKVCLTDAEEQQLENKLVREANRVVLKVMTKLDQFERELDVRGLSFSGGPGAEWGPGGARDATGLGLLDGAHVVNIIRSHKVRRAARSHTHTHTHTHTYTHTHTHTHTHAFLELLTNMRTHRLRRFPASKVKCSAWSCRPQIEASSTSSAPNASQAWT